MILLLALALTAPRINYIPDPSITPGVVDPQLTDARLTDPSFRTGTVRNVPKSLRDRCFADYGIPPGPHPDYELDHFISIGIGGASDEKNLWPEPHHFNLNGRDAGSFTKDKLEAELVREVRLLKVTPAEARAEETSDWTVAYIKRWGQLPVYAGN